jgi:hypothetical protein
MHVRTNSTPALVTLCLCVLVVALLAVSCSDSSLCPEPEVHVFTVRIDSLQIEPGAPCEGDTLTLRFFGLLGDCGSERFTGFETYRDTFQLDVTVWAERPSIAPCFWEDTYLEGEPLQLCPVHAGELLVIVHQPDGPALVRVIEVSGPAGEL